MLSNAGRRFIIVLVLIAVCLPAGFCAKAFADSPDMPARVRLILSRISPMLENGEYEKAEKILLEFRAKGGPTDKQEESDAKGYHHPEIYFALGNCYTMQEKYESAAKAYRSAVKRDPDHTKAWLNLARASYELDRPSEAGRFFLKGYETAEEKRPEHLYHGALSYLMAEDYDRCLELFKRLQNVHAPAFKPEWKENFVHALLGAGQPGQALPYIRELARTYTGEKQRQWQEILLHQYLQLEMHDKALDLALRLTSQAPTVEKWWKALANIHLNAGRYEESLSALITYSFLTPLSGEEKKLIADLCLELGIPVKAAPIYEDYLKQHPDSKLLQRLAHAYRQLGSPEKALDRIEKFGKNPDDADLLLLKAELHYALEHYGKATEFYREAARKKDTGSGHAWLMAGYAAWHNDDLSASRQAFKRAATYENQKKTAQKALARISKSETNPKSK